MSRRQLPPSSARGQPVPQHVQAGQCLRALRLFSLSPGTGRPPRFCPVLHRRARKLFGRNP